MRAQNNIKIVNIKLLLFQIKRQYTKTCLIAALKKKTTKLQVQVYNIYKLAKTWLWPRHTRTNTKQVSHKPNYTHI